MSLRIKNRMNGITEQQLRTLLTTGFKTNASRIISLSDLGTTKTLKTPPQKEGDGARRWEVLLGMEEMRFREAAGPVEKNLGISFGKIAKWERNCGGMTVVKDANEYFAVACLVNKLLGLTDVWFVGDLLGRAVLDDTLYRTPGHWRNFLTFEAFFVSPNRALSWCGTEWFAPMSRYITPPTEFGMVLGRFVETCDPKED